MRINSRYLAVTMCLALASLELQASGASASAQNTDLAVTATSGESWLNHVHRSFGDTSMGGKRDGWAHLPRQKDRLPRDGKLGLAPPSNQPLELHGSDLYRLNCQKLATARPDWELRRKSTPSSIRFAPPPFHSFSIG